MSEYNSFDDGSMANVFNMPSFDAGRSFNIPQQPVYSDAPRYAPQGSGYAGSPENYNPGAVMDESIPRPNVGLWEQLSSGKQGMDNLFRLGGVGVSGLAAFLQDRDASRNNRRVDSAVNNLMSMQDPRANLWASQIQSMLDNPANYLNDPLDVQMSAQAEEAARRQNQLAGRGGMTADQLLNIQGVRQKSRDNRLKTLVDLFGRAGDRNALIAQAAANLQARPMQSASPAMVGLLRDIYGQTRGAAADAGIASNTRQAPTLPSNYSTLSGI